MQTTGDLRQLRRRTLHKLFRQLPHSLPSMGPDGHHREKGDYPGSRILPTMLRPKDIHQDWNRLDQAPRGQVLRKMHKQTQVHLIEQGLPTTLLDLLRPHRGKQTPTGSTP